MKVSHSLQKRAPRCDESVAQPAKEGPGVMEVSRLQITRSVRRDGSMPSEVPLSGRCDESVTPPE
eukprot:1035105-Pyramimonas_sp.AAC.1